MRLQLLIPHQLTTFSPSKHMRIVFLFHQRRAAIVLQTGSVVQRETTTVGRGVEPTAGPI
jgi:hypothetical protein